MTLTPYHNDWLRFLPFFPFMAEWNLQRSLQRTLSLPFPQIASILLKSNIPLYQQLLLGMDFWAVESDSVTMCVKLHILSSYVPGEFTFLDSLGKNLETSREVKVQVYLSKNMLSLKRQADRWGAAALGLFGKQVLMDIEMKWWNIHWGSRSLGVIFIFPDFHPSFIFLGGGGTFALI